MAVLFSKILEDAKNRLAGSRYGDEELRDFFRDKALQAVSKNVNPRKIINTKKAKNNWQDRPMPGKMMCFFYDAKHKATLPYWDKFPVVFPIEFYGDGFLGINLHYLPPIYRARLMDKLYDLLNNQRYDEKTKLKISYEILKGASKFRYFRPCVKRYLYSHVQSSFVMIDVREWDYFMMLPLARFQKQKNRQVWDDSIKIINKAKR